MTNALYIAAAFAIGLGNATQMVMVSAMARSRGSVEGAFTSLASTVAGFALLLGIQAWRQGSVSLPIPFDKWPFYGGLVVLSSLGLFFILRGLNGYFVVTGLFAIPFLVGAGFIGPRVGIGLFLVAVLAGQMVGAVVHDHIGSFGTEIHRVDAIRAVGVLALITGVVLVKGVR